MILRRFARSSPLAASRVQSVVQKAQRRQRQRSSRKNRRNHHRFPATSRSCLRAELSPCGGPWPPFPGIASRNSAGTDPRHFPTIRNFPIVAGSSRRGFFHGGICLRLVIWTLGRIATAAVRSKYRETRPSPLALCGCERSCDGLCRQSSTLRSVPIMAFLPMNWVCSRCRLTQLRSGHAIYVFAQLQSADFCSDV